jgi:hypothetical protein
VKASVVWSPTIEIRQQENYMIAEFQIQDTVRKLNQMELKIRGLLAHVPMLRGSRENIEARTFLETSNQLSLVGSELEEYLRHLVGEAESAARRFPPPRSYRARNLSQQNALNQGFASAVGYRNELRALAKRLPGELDDLHRQLGFLAREANRGVNDPGRYGDLAAPGPVTDVLALVFQVLDAVAKKLKRK